jgi:hypothetical protein
MRLVFWRIFTFYQRSFIIDVLYDTGGILPGENGIIVGLLCGDVRRTLLVGVEVQ